jgi:hypothetical protein
VIDTDLIEGRARFGAPTHLKTYESDEVSVAFNKKNRKDEPDDRGSSIAVEKPAPPQMAGNADGVNRAPVSSNGSAPSQGAQGSAVATMEGTRTAVVADESVHHDKIATPFKGRLGDLLVQSDLITVVQLDEALAKQAESGGKIGEVLVGMGAIDARALADALASVPGSRSS